MSDKTVVVTHPISAAGVVPLSHLISIVKRISGDVSLITGNEGWKTYRGAEGIEVQGIMTVRHRRLLGRALGFVRTQLWTSMALAHAAKGSRNVIFFAGGDYLLAPLLTSRVLGKRAILVMVGSSYQMMRSSADPFSRPMELLSRVVFALSNKILVYSPGSISEMGLEPLRGKVTVCYEHFVDTLPVADRKRLEERENIVGYVGRLTPEKGVMNLVEALPSLVERERGLRVVLCGDGPLRGEIERFAAANLPPGTLELAGWIDHKELPHHIAEMKLVVLPSYTEGLPNVLLEAMVQGTPVLATPVGSIPEVIRDGQTGFILGGNDPKTIADAVVRVLHDPRLPQVSEDASAYVRREFGFERTLSRWRSVLNA